MGYHKKSHHFHLISHLILVGGGSTTADETEAKLLKALGKHKGGNNDQGEYEGLVAALMVKEDPNVGTGENGVKDEAEKGKVQGPAKLWEQAQKVEVPLLLMRQKQNCSKH